jgi:hypothetical protein
MASTVEMLALIKERFPDRDGAIERAFWREPAFRGACQDLRDCLAALERLRRLDSSDKLTRELEYAALLEDLTREIGTWLDEHDDQAPTC